MSERPDSAAQAALDGDVRRPVTLVWLDIDGEPIRVTDAPYSIAIASSDDADLVGTFDVVDSRFTDVSPIQLREDGSETVTLTLSGLAAVDDELMTVIGDKARWQGRDCRIWRGMLDPQTAQLIGAVWADYTGVMSTPKIVGDKTSQTIRIEAESYLTYFSQPSNRTYQDQADFDAGDRSAEMAIAIANGANARRAMQRYVDWEVRLAAYLEPLHAREFAWGRHDCCIFSAGAVEAMTGVDPMPEFRGHYRTAIGSARALRRFGAGTLAATLDTKFDRVPASLAQRGDVVMSGGLLGICLGAVLVAVGSEGDREGLITIARARWGAPIAWRVPY